MIILRDCPEHEVALEIAGSQLQCPVMVDTTWTGDIWEGPKRHYCTHTEPLPPDVALRAGGAEMLFKEEE